MLGKGENSEETRTVDPDYLCTCSNSKDYLCRRNFFGTVFRWAEEIAIYSVVWITFLASVLCLKNGEHTRIEVFINLFPHRIRKWIEVFDYVVCFAFMALLAYHSIELLKINGAFRTAGANIPMYMVYSCIMVSGILMIPYFAILIFSSLF